ncbi:MAG: CRISPR-associated endonuclease Cas1 [Desulfococcus multivorans]|jgi:CRISPR-associated protein Cas1|nr:CRISPR-associated endonuclease Cas1 [Desulfococcus multivorans]
MGNPAAETIQLIPVSYLNAYVYCPRRFFLEHNRGMFEDNTHTVEGRTLHRVVDGRHAARPEKKGDLIHRHSVSLSSMRLGIAGKLDLLEERNGQVYPVEYKKGKKPPKGREPWLNDQVQLCAQALLMGDNGMGVPERAFLYFIGSKSRVEVLLDEALIQETERIISECRSISRSNALPPLATNRNKCFGCSLNAVCLPEEEEVCRGAKTNARAILPMGLDGDVLYVDTIGAWVSLSEGHIRIVSPDGVVLGKHSLEMLREVHLCGPAQMTTQALHECLKRGIPVHYLNTHGRYVGTTSAMNHFHGVLRRAQWKAHFDPIRSLDIAKTIAASKLTNMRTLMMRYLREGRSAVHEKDFRRIKDFIRQVQSAENLGSLRGFEGMASRIYFSRLAEYIKTERKPYFDFTDRNRRPPRDPVNSLLGFGYSLLAKDCTSTAIRVGFDPFCGYYHIMKYGRPSLALDIMEVFRQPIVDSVVISSINNDALVKSSQQLSACNYIE